jgi:siroheme synthase (precorrin-2 oxidase/ferrochelatase)
MLARAWREKLEKMIGPEWGAWVALLETKRQHILSEVRDEAQRVRLLRRLGDMRWANRVKRKGIAHVHREVDKLIKAFK